MKNNEKTLDYTALASFFLDNIEQVKTAEDPLLLKEFYKTFKKSVPLTLRSYFIGFMLKSLSENSNTRGNRYLKNHDRNKFSRDRKSSEISRKNETRPMLDKELATTLFIGIGRNRRVFPRDIVGLLTQAANIDRDHIGEIRILENYSFVQVLISEAEEIINKLNGYEYRGRKIAVSYSKKRESNDVTTETETDSSYKEESLTNNFSDSYNKDNDSDIIEEKKTSEW